MSTLRQFWRHYRRTSGAKHELLALALSLGLGVVLMPALVWIMGSWKLGPYANGGPLALWRDFLVALFHGSIPYCWSPWAPTLACGCCAPHVLPSIARPAQPRPGGFPSICRLRHNFGPNAIFCELPDAGIVGVSLPHQV